MQNDEREKKSERLSKIQVKVGTLLEFLELSSVKHNGQHCDVFCEGLSNVCRTENA